MRNNINFSKMIQCYKKHHQNYTLVFIYIYFFIIIVNKRVQETNCKDLNVNLNFIFSNQELDRHLEVLQQMNVSHDAINLCLQNIKAFLVKNRDRIGKIIALSIQKP